MSTTPQSLDENQTAILPPYTAFPSFKTALSVFKNVIVPDRVDRSVWIKNFSGSVVTQMLTTFKFLGLISNEGVPTPRLRTLVDALGTEQWPSELRAVLQSAYAPILASDLEKVSATQFNERFRQAYKAEGETARKCMTFFLQAAREAGIALSPFLLSGSKPRAASGAGVRRKAKATGKSAAANDDPPPPYVPPPPAPPSNPVDVLMSIMDMEAMDEKEAEAVWTLVKFLKRPKGKAASAAKHGAS